MVGYEADVERYIKYMVVNVDSPNISVLPELSVSASSSHCVPLVTVIHMSRASCMNFAVGTTSPQEEMHDFSRWRASSSANWRSG